MSTLIPIEKVRRGINKALSFQQEEWKENKRKLIESIK